MILRFGSISELVLIEYWKAGMGRESPDANGKVRPVAACRALEKRTFDDFAERPRAEG
jgi:hypothetical protein